MSDRPDTQVLAKVYQLYMVENQCASMLMSHSQGVVEPTLRAKITAKPPHHTVFLHSRRRPLSGERSQLSSCSDILRSFTVKKAHRPIVMMVAVVKKPLLRKADFQLNIRSCFTCSAFN